MTQKEIKELIKADEQRLLEAKEGYKDIPEYQKIQEELDELSRKKAELENRKYQIQVDYRKEAESDIDFAREELAYSKDLLRKLQYGLDVNEYNDELIKMFKAFYSGSTWGYRKKLQWVSDDGCYAIFKVEAHSAYTDRMSGSVSSPASWCLFLIDPDFSERSLEPRSELCLWHKEGGRWGDKRDMDIIEEVIENYETNKFMDSHMESLGFKLQTSHHSRPQWINENIIIKYTIERTPSMGLDKGKTTITEHERPCTLYIGHDYYIDMPKNISEFEKKYPDLIKEINENK
jgi:hypothetical protein